MAWLRYLVSDVISQSPAEKGRLADPSKPCETLNRMLRSGWEGLSRHVINSEEVVEYSILAWAAEDSGTGHAYISLRPNEACPIISLFGQFFFQDEH